MNKCINCPNITEYDMCTTCSRAMVKESLNRHGKRIDFS